MDLIHIRLHDHGQDVLIADAVVGDLNALDGGELAADHLLQGALQVRIAVIAKLGRKAHDRTFTHADSHTQTARGHERGLVVVL